MEIYNENELKEVAARCAENDIQLIKELKKKGYTEEQIGFFFERFDFHLKKLMEKLRSNTNKESKPHTQTPTRK